MDKDLVSTMEQSILIEPENIKTNLFQKILRSVVRIFAPLL